MNQNKTIIYLKKEIMGILDFNNIDNLEEYLRKIINNLKTIYNIDIKGFYNIKVYIDDLYGAILELEAEDLDYGDYFNQIEMRIIPIYTDFLYQIDDCMFKLGKIYSYKNNIYLKIDKDISFKDYISVMDYAKIVYNNTDKIIDYGRELSF